MHRSPSRSSSNVAKTVVIGGLIAGTLDITAAIVQFYINTGKGPEPIFRFIASGIFGKDAFTGDSSMIIWGIVLHYIIALCFAALFVFLYVQFKWLRSPIVIWGLLYGILAWIIMNRIVLPLSRTNPIPFHIGKAALAMLILMLMIGLPIALITRKYDPQ